MKKIGNIAYEVTGTTNQSIRIIAPKNTTLYLEKGRSISASSGKNNIADWDKETENIPLNEETQEVSLSFLERGFVHIHETTVAKQAGENPNFIKFVSKRDDGYVIIDSHFIGQILTLTINEYKNFFYREGLLLATAHEEGTSIALDRQMITGNAKKEEGDAFRAEQLGIRAMCQIKVRGTALLIFEMKGDHNKIVLPKKGCFIDTDPKKFLLSSPGVQIRCFPSTSDSKNVRDNIGYDYSMRLEAIADNQVVYLASQIQENHYTKI